MSDVTINLSHLERHAASAMRSAIKTPLLLVPWRCCCARLIAWLLPVCEGFSCKNQHNLPANYK